MQSNSVALRDVNCVSRAQRIAGCVKNCWATAQVVNYLGNQPFYDPHHKKMTDVRVYGIHLTKDREEDRIGYYVDRPRRNMEALRNFQEHIGQTII